MFSDGAHVYVCNAQFCRNILQLFTVEKFVQRKKRE